VSLRIQTDADADSGRVHSVHATAANESDVAHIHEVPHGDESVLVVDPGYKGVEKRPAIVAAQESGEIRDDIDWHVAQARSTIKKMLDCPAKDI
jgi:IS5 family transposase